MKALKKISLLLIPIVFISAKCKEAKTKEFVQKATVKTINGGVYGSGYSTTYKVIFTEKVKKELSFDSIFISSGNGTAYKKVSNENGWGLKKLESGMYEFSCQFSGGEKMQADGSIKNIIIPTFPQPTRMGENQGLLYGKYNGKTAVISIDKFELQESINMP
jgi:hypothetical protein